MNTLNLKDISVGPESVISDVIKCIQESGAVACCLYYDKAGKFVNIFTDGDVRRAFLAGYGLSDLVARVSEIKEKSQRSLPITLHVNSSDIIKKECFIKNSLRQLVLVDDNDVPVDVICADRLCYQHAYQRQEFSAVIMAGGFGTRMRPLTDFTPKPMLKVNGRPILEISIMKLIEFGVRRFFITTHYMPEKIVDHFGDGSHLGVEICYVHEHTPLGTGGALSLIDQVDDNMPVFNGDILTNLDVRMFFAHHIRHNASLTIASTQYRVEVPFGVLSEENGDVTRIDEKPVYNFMVNSGIYFISRSAFDFLPREGKYNMTDVAEILIKNKKKVECFPIYEHWLDVGRPSDYDIASSIFE